MATKELNKTSLCWIVHRSNLRFCNFGFEMLDSCTLKFPREPGRALARVWGLSIPSLIGPRLPTYTTIRRSAL